MPHKGANGKKTVPPSRIRIGDLPLGAAQLTTRFMGFSQEIPARFRRIQKSRPAQAAAMQVPIESLNGSMAIGWLLSGKHGAGNWISTQFVAQAT